MNDNIETNKKKIDKRTIKISVLIAAAVLLVAGIIAISLNKTAINTNITYALMPKSISDNIEGNEVTFYVRKNKNYDPKKNAKQPLEAFEFYYYDEDGKEVNLGSNKAYKINGKSVLPSILFMIKVQQNIKNFKNILFSIVIPVISVIVIGAAVFFWYKAWCRQQEKEKAEKFKNANKNKKKK